MRLRMYVVLSLDIADPNGVLATERRTALPPCGGAMAVIASLDGIAHGKDGSSSEHAVKVAAEIAYFGLVGARGASESRPQSARL
jgi:hypothetical protein